MESQLSWHVLRIDKDAENTVIKSSFLKKQIIKSKRQRITAPFLQRLVFTTVDQVARDHYESDYPMKCLQTAAAVGMLLDNLGIKNRLLTGAACFAEAFEQSGVVTWGGFWDRDHHVWLVTVFGELVDLSISQMHRHPKRNRADGIPVLPIWWDDRDVLPSMICYLPDGPVKIGFDDPEDTEDLKIFLEKVCSRFNETTASGHVDDVKFSPILTNLRVMHELHERGHPWLVRVLLFQDRAVPFPLWIQRREAELHEASCPGTSE